FRQAFQAEAGVGPELPPKVSISTLSMCFPVPPLTASSSSMVSSRIVFMISPSQAHKNDYKDGGDETWTSVSLYSTYLIGASPLPPETWSSSVSVSSRMFLAVVVLVVSISHGSHSVRVR